MGTGLPDIVLAADLTMEMNDTTSNDFATTGEKLTSKVIIE